MCWSCTKEMQNLRQVVSDHQRTAHQILWRLCTGDKLHRTCRQIGNLKGREQRELADDHPVKQIYEKRLNTINRYVKRGTLDADLAEVMKKLAKDKMLRALSNVAYAKGAYEKEMDQAALKKEASAKIYKERDKHE